MFLISASDPSTSRIPFTFLVRTFVWFKSCFPSYLARCLNCKNNNWVCGHYNLFRTNLNWFGIKLNWLQTQHRLIQKKRQIEAKNINLVQHTLPDYHTMKTLTNILKKFNINYRAGSCNKTNLNPISHLTFNAPKGNCNFDP